MNLITKQLSIAVLAILLFTACNKTHVIHREGRVIEIADWEFNKTGVGIPNAKVCLFEFTSPTFSNKINPTGRQVCGLTDGGGNYSLNLEVKRKHGYALFLPKQEGIELDPGGYGTTVASPPTNYLGYQCLVASRIYPVVFTLNNVNYLNDRDSLIIKSYLRFMGKQNNTIIRGVYKGTKRYTNPASVGGGFGYQAFRNGVEVANVYFDEKILLQGDTGYYTINY